MHPDMLIFLDALLQRCAAFHSSAYLTLTAIHPDGQHHTPSRHIALPNRPALLDALQRLSETNRVGWGAYFAVGLRRARLPRFRRGGDQDVAALPAFYVDVDSVTAETLARLRAFQPAPSLLVHSGGGFHAYWMLDAPTTDVDTARRVLQGLAKALGGDGLSPAQSLRLPGTVNTKPERGGALCHMVEVSDRHYLLSDFRQFIPSPKRLSAPHRAAEPLSTQSGRTLNPALIRVITDALYRDHDARERRGSAWIAARCPYGHERDSPGKHFFFNPDIGCGRCHGRHGTLRLTDLCSILGIDAATHGGVYR